MAENVKSETHYEEILSRYFSFICRTITPTRILPHLTFLDEGTEQEICHKEVNESHLKATRMLLEALKKKNENRYYREFINALGPAGYKYLKDLLESKTEIQDQTLYFNVMKFISPQLFSQLDPSGILPELVKEGVISEVDQQEIIAKSDSRGDYQANFILWDKVSKRQKDWFPKFVYVLNGKGGGYAHILKTLDMPILAPGATIEDTKRMVESWHEKLKAADENRPYPIGSEVLHNYMEYEDDDIQTPLENPNERMDSIQKEKDIAEEKHNKDLIRQYRPLIVKHLQPNQILPKLMTLKIFQEHDNSLIFLADGPETASEILLDCLLKSDEPGWYQTFLEALTENGFEIIARTLKGFSDVKNPEIFKRLISMFYEELHSSIRIEKILPHLLNTRCINSQDADEIIAANGRKGNPFANLMLLDRIGKKREDWFGCLMYALIKCDQRDLVEQIEPKLKQTGSFMEIQRVTDMMLEEHNATASAYPDINKAPVQKRTSETKMDVDAVYEEYEVSIQTEVKRKLNPRPVPDTQQHEVKPPSLNLNLNEGNHPPSVSKVGDRNMGNMHQNIDVTTQPRREYPQNDLSNPDNSDLNSQMTNASKYSFSESNWNGSSIHGGKSNSTTSSVEVSAGNFQSDPVNQSRFAPNREEPIGQESEAKADSNFNFNNHKTSLDKDVKIKEKAFSEKGRQDYFRSDVEELEKQKTRKTNMAIDGENTLILAANPNFPAVHISTERYRKWNYNGCTSKVLFFVETNEDGKRVSELYKRGDCLSATLFSDQKELLLSDSHTVFIMTPIVFLNAVKCGAVVDFDKFSMLIFADCTVKSYFYKIIMACYFKEKSSKQTFPQVIALGGHKSIGDVTDATAATDTIFKLAAIFDATNIFSVQEEKKYVMDSMPQTDDFQMQLIALMDIIERKMLTSQEVKDVKIPDFKQEIQPPSLRGSDDYATWVKIMQSTIAPINDQQISNLLVACLYYLGIYNKAIMLNSYCRSKDIFAYIGKQIQEFADRNKSSEDIKIESKSKLKYMKSVAENCPTPKLNKLQELVLRHYSERGSRTKIMIFTSDKDAVTALHTWMDKDPCFQPLHPKKIAAGMSQDFNHGRKVNLTTTKGEANIDVEKCTMVIYYERLRDNSVEIMFKESTGKEHYITRKLTAENKLTDDLMHEAVSKITKLSPKEKEDGWNQNKDNTYTYEVHSTLEDIVSSALSKPTDESAYSFYCMKKKEFICFSSDIRTEKGRFMISKARLLEKCKFKLESGNLDKDGFKREGKCLCIKCDYSLGIIYKYEDVEFVVLNISSFELKDPQGQKLSPFMKWRDIPESLRACILEFKK